MNTWFTADLHMGHANIINYCNRPFKNLDSMNTTLIRNWNSRVKPEDIVYHGGDFCFKNSKGGKRGEGGLITAKEWESKLNGKIIFIRGNHDNNNSCKTPILDMSLYFGKKHIQLIHNPEKIKNEYYNLYFTGHVHNNWKIKRFKKMFNFIDCINVGIDVWNFYPVSFNEIISRYNQWLKTQ